MNVEREWLATLALNLVDSYNYSTRRALDKVLDDFQIEDQAIRSTLNALLIETIRRKNIIDRIANYILDKKFQSKESLYPSLKRLDPKVKNLLRIMIYRIKFELHPPELVANTSKIILQKKYEQYIETFGNWLSFLSEIDPETIISNSKDPIDRLALETWEPYFLVQRFYQIYQKKAKDILEYFKEKSPIYIRIKNLKDKTVAFKEFNEFNVVLEQDKYMEDVYKVIKSDVPMARMKGFKCGFFYIQSRSSAFISHFLDPLENEIILDSCAAPGSKTTHIASLTQDKCKIIALEIDKQRIEMLKRTIERCGVKQVNVLNEDAKDPDLTFTKPFDKILLDAPCSGSGTLSSKTHAKWRIKNSLIKKYSKLQYDILVNVSKYLKKDGLLLYSTCSLLPEENEEVVDQFLKKFSNFEPTELPFPDLGENIMFKGKRLLPQDVNSEGFSIFLLKNQFKN